MARQSLPKLLRVTNLQKLCNISREKWGMKLIFIATSITICFKWYYYFWWVWPDMPKLLKIRRQCLLQYLMNELSYKAVLLADRHKSLLQVENIIFDEFGLVCPKYPAKFAMSLWHLKKEDRYDFRNLTALPDLKADVTIYLFSYRLPFSSLHMEPMPSLFCIWLFA